MEWINHHNPDLVILDEDDNELERIDLTPYDRPGALEKLLEEKGFIMK